MNLDRSTNISLSPKLLFIYGVTGVIFGFAVLLWPNEAFPFVWVAPILILEPIAYYNGVPCILLEVKRGHFLPLVAITTSTLINGFWWECWNFYSDPKWIYTIPYVGFWKIFEMPALGYLGYPF